MSNEPKTVCALTPDPKVLAKTVERIQKLASGETILIPTTRSVRKSTLAYANDLREILAANSVKASDD